MFQFRNVRLPSNWKVYIVQYYYTNGRPGYDTILSTCLLSFEEIKTKIECVHGPVIESGLSPFVLENEWEGPLDWDCTVLHSLPCYCILFWDPEMPLPSTNVDIPHYLLHQL